MWHVALQCHAAADTLLTVHLFSYCLEVVQIVSHLSLTELWLLCGGVLFFLTYRTLCTIFLRHGGVYNSVFNNYVLFNFGTHNSQLSPFILIMSNTLLILLR